MIDMVGCSWKGSITAVEGSGIRIMSDSEISWKPRIEEPSKPRPSSNASGSSPWIDSETCCQVPGRSVNLKSTIRTPCLPAISNTCRASGSAVSAKRWTVSGVWGIAVVLTGWLLSSRWAGRRALGVLACAAGLGQRLDQLVEPLAGQRLEHLRELGDDPHHVLGHPVRADPVPVPVAADHHDLLRLGERLRDRGGELGQDGQQAVG